MNQLFAIPRQRLLKALWNWETVAVRLLAFNTAYTFNEDHTTVSQIGAPLAQSELLTGKVATVKGYARSNAAYFTSIGVAAPVTFFVLAEDIGGASSTWKPMAYIDEAEGLPFTPNGAEKTVVPDWITNQGWFRA